MSIFRNSKENSSLLSKSVVFELECEQCDARNAVYVG